MSFDINVLANNSEFFPKKWEAEIGKYFDGFAFEPGIDWEKHTGFLPVSWNNQDNIKIEAGFEFYFKKSTPKLSFFKRVFGKKSNRQDLDFWFSLSSLDNDYKIGWIAAALLTELLNATLLDPQDGNIYDRTNVLKQALKEIK